MTHSDEVDDLGAALLKLDVKGRVKSTVGQREALLDEFERSSLSGPKFCQAAGLNYQTFCGWRRQRQKNRAGEGVTMSRSEACASPPVQVGSISWMEAKLEGAWSHRMQEGGHLRICLAQGVHMELVHHAQVPLAVTLLQAMSGTGRFAC